VGNHTEAYQTFDDMLKKFDRDDMDKLWSLVKERFSSTDPTDDKERTLWVELKRLFEPDTDDIMWKLQRYMHDPLTWKLYDTCGVHHVSTDRGHDIFMLVEKDYPLTIGLLTLMLCNKLQVDQYSEMANELLRKIASTYFIIETSFYFLPLFLKPNLSIDDLLERTTDLTQSSMSDDVCSQQFRPQSSMSDDVCSQQFRPQTSMSDDIPLENTVLEIILHQQRTLHLLKQKTLMQTQEDHSNQTQALNSDSLKVDLVVKQNSCSEKEDSNSETASNKSAKECSLNSDTSDVHAIDTRCQKQKKDAWHIFDLFIHTFKFFQKMT
ncbi:hypothetical protein Tco_1158506, partial [Tanacetum coccineum]